MESTLSVLPSQQTVFLVGEPSQISAVRRGGAKLARSLGFDETATGRVALVITEAATNIVKHAERGSILLRAVVNDEERSIEVIAMDSGRGMRNFAQSMEDGSSTSGSYGVGLSAMRRQSDEFDVYTAHDRGTVIFMLISGSLGKCAGRRSRMGVVCVPVAGEEQCGDAWTLVESSRHSSVLIADGLGHGPEAAVASRAAVLAIQQDQGASPTKLMRDAHAALHATRGAAVAIARVDFDACELRFAGVGNISAVLQQGGLARALMSHNGIVGSNLRKVEEFVLPWSNDSLLIMHSDGIRARWQLDQYAGLALRHPSLIAAVIYRDFARNRDDAAIVVFSEL